MYATKKDVPHRAASFESEAFLKSKCTDDLVPDDSQLACLEDGSALQSKRTQIVRFNGFGLSATRNGGRPLRRDGGRVFAKEATTNSNQHARSSGAALVRRRRCQMPQLVRIAHHVQRPDHVAINLKRRSLYWSLGGVHDDTREAV